MKIPSLSFPPFEFTQDKLQRESSILKKWITDRVRNNTVGQIPDHVQKNEYRNGDLRIKLLVCLFLIVMTFGVYWQVSHHEFVNYDDNVYVTENPHVNSVISLQNIVWAFKTTHASNWHPLTWLSHMLDVQFFGLKPGWHHLMNVFFHILNTVLLFLVFNRMTRALWPSAFVATLFALHPLHVESVAWVAERKDVLSTLFWILTMGAYTFYVEHPSTKRYLFTLGLFALGLMAKPMLVTLPFVLLLLDYWPFRRLQYAQPTKDRQPEVSTAKDSKKQKRKSQRNAPAALQKKKNIDSEISWSSIQPLLKEKIPFFVLAAMSSAITIYAQRGVIESSAILSLSARMANALVSYLGYLGKIFWPQKLAVFYPHPGMWPLWQVAGSAFVIACVTAAVIIFSKRFPYITIGWLWYMGTLVPVIGLVQVGLQSMADRYTYVPLIGIAVIVAWGVPDMMKRAFYKPPLLAVLSGITLLLLMACTWNQIQYWQNSLTLFSHAINVTTRNSVAHNNLGTALLEQGAFDKAIPQFQNALTVDPRNANANNNMGNALIKHGRMEEAIFYCREALRIKPDYPEALTNLGNALAYQGKSQEAIDYFEKALRINPEYAGAYISLGYIFADQRKLDDAVDYFNRALRIKPNYAEAHYNLGNILVALGKTDEAISHFKEALKIKPDYAKAYNNLGSTLLLQGKTDEAILYFQEALRLQPDYQVAIENLKVAMDQKKRSRQGFL